MSDHTPHLRLEAFVDGELAATEAARAEAHLASCAGCRQGVTATRALDEALAEPLPAAPPSFAARTCARALGRRLPAVPLWWLALPAPWRLGLAALLAVAAVAGARLGQVVTADRSADAELAAALAEPATEAILAAPAAGSTATEVQR